jgi:hypothetical protein
LASASGRVWWRVMSMLGIFGGLDAGRAILAVSQECCARA